MASYAARLEVEGQHYPVVLCSYSFAQATGPRGRASEGVRHGLLELVLDVPDGDQLLRWATTPHQPFTGRIAFYQASDQMARELVEFTDGECVSYQEVFEAGADLIGSYRCALTIAARKLQPTAGGPLASAAEGSGALAVPAGEIAGAAGPAASLVKAAGPAAATTRAASALANVPIGGQHLYREDNAPYVAQGKVPGRLKSFIDAAGNLSPANPLGQATIQDHIRGSEPRKSDSPYTSTSGVQNVGKSYGDHEIRIDREGLTQAIASGEVTDVAIIPNAEIVAHLQSKLDAAQTRFDNNPSKKNQEAVNRAKGDIENTTRDQEILVKGVVPAKFVQVTKKPSNPV